MPVDPYEFASKEHLIEQLRIDSARLGKWFEPRVDLDDVVTNSVGSDTFRVFHHTPERPSVAFRSWVSEWLVSGRVMLQISNIASQSEYDGWLRDFRSDLFAYWENQMGPQHRMAFGHSTKLTDLLMKRLMLWEEVPNQQRISLLQFLHVPFDKYCLAPLRNCVQQSNYREQIGIIPRNAAMGFVSSEPKYTALQMLARDIAQEAGVPPIYLEVLAWDKSHGLI